MREIKFRAWDKKNKKMRNISGFTMDIIEGCVESVCFEGMEGKSIWNWRVDQYSDVQQFTGLKDRFDKEIYEGDIIKMESGITQLIKFGEGLFEVWDDENTRGFPFGIWNINKESEVIGNIYENKELLK